MVSRNREHQAAIYGEPLRAVFDRVGEHLGLTQARVARILGLSAPMLSQLAGGHRVKIGNPAAVQRLQALVALAGGVAAGRIIPGEVEARLAEIASQSAVMTHSTTSGGVLPPVVAARAIQGVIRAVADAEELLDAAATIEKRHPEIAKLLRIYGAGRTQDAIAHYESYAHLV
jgi:transcriptional regulator with XRE-family HTH domain